MGRECWGRAGPRIGTRWDGQGRPEDGAGWVGQARGQGIRMGRPGPRTGMGWDGQGRQGRPEEWGWGWGWREWQEGQWRTAGRMAVASVRSTQGR